MGKKQVALAKKPSSIEWPLGPKQSKQVRKAVAKLYGQGLTRAKIAKAYCGYIVPPRKTYQAHVSAAAKQLREWERDPAFRDMVWDSAVVDLDMSTPAILRGVGKRAAAGHVDAAKLALSITKRFRETGGGVATNVQIVFTGDIPRPAVMDPPALSSEVRAIARQAEPLAHQEEVVEGEVVG